TTAEFLSSTGTGSVSAAPAWVGSTGTGLVVLQTSPTLITPDIGVAIGTTLALGGTLDSLLTVEGTCTPTDYLFRIGDDPTTILGTGSFYVGFASSLIVQKD